MAPVLFGSTVRHSAQPARISAAEPVFSSPGFIVCPATLFWCWTYQPFPIVEARTQPTPGQLVAFARSAPVSEAPSYARALALSVGGVRAPDSPQTRTE